MGACNPETVLKDLIYASEIVRDFARLAYLWKGPTEENLERANHLLEEGKKSFGKIARYESEMGWALSNTQKKLVYDTIYSLRCKMAWAVEKIDPAQVAK